MQRKSQLPRRRLNSVSRAVKSRSGRLRGSAAIEQLEYRSLLAGDLTINEFMAANDNGIVDEDGAHSDWLEIHNTTNAPVNLAGWHLTNSATNLTKWTFPNMTLGPDGYQLVFASSKNRAVAGSELHTNFKLSAGGDYLALVRPDNVSIEFAYSPSYTTQHSDVSYGIGQTVTINNLVSTGAAAKVLIPTGNALGTTWTGGNEPFNDASWTSGPTGVGYELSVPGFAVKNYKANVTVDSLAIADQVIATPAMQTSVVAANRPVINLAGNGTGANFGGDLSFPGSTVGADVEDFVIEAVGTITIPAAGNWTFGVNSDDGFRLDLTNGQGSNFTMSFPNPRGPGDTFGVFNAPAAGAYSARLVFYERGGGDEVELFAAQGNVPTFGAQFRLVGDTANGGLAVESASVGTETSGYHSLIATDVQSAMSGVNASAYLRIPFNVANPLAYTSLNLRMKYDDGFVAYLNGTLVASRNSPGSLSYNSSATGDHASNQAMQFENININSALGLLHAGTNILAIQALNDSKTSNDFLMVPELAEITTVETTQRFFTTPTPGTFNNSAGVIDFVADTVFNVDRGFYDTPFDVTITSATPGATIRYTTDGTTPTATTGIVYAGPIHIAGTTNLRAAAFKTNFEPSEVDTHTYIFLNDVVLQEPTGAVPPGWPADGLNGQTMNYGMDPNVVNNAAFGPALKPALKAIPTISLTTDLSNLFDANSGIYVHASNDGPAWERPVSVELINPDGTDGFQIDAGLRIRGGYSRSGDNPKHALRLFFNDDYAGDLKFPLFGDDGADDFSKIDLRTAQNYSWSFGGDPNNHMLQDDFARDTQGDMGQPHARSVWYHLYIDGQYWGLYETQERTEANFGETYIGGVKDDYDVVKVETTAGYNIEATDGNLNAWNDLWNLANQVASPPVGETSLSVYQKLQGLNPDGSRNPAYPVLLDVDNLIDYMQVIFYGGNLDAPISAFLGNTSPNNWYGMRDRNGDTGFQFFAHDSEHTLLNVNENRMGPFPAGSDFNKSNPQWIHQQLMNTLEYRLRFADHVQQNFFNGGVLTPQAALDRFNERVVEIDQAIIAESARWGDSKTEPALTRDNWLSAVNNVRNNFLAGRSGVVLNQFRGTTNGGPLYPALVPAIFNINAGPQHGGIIVPGDSLTMVPQPGSSGTIYYTTDGSDPRLVGGAVSPTAQQYSSAITLSDTKHIKMRVLSGGNWSPLDEATFAIDTSALRVTELMYNPLPPAGGPYTTDDFQYVELQNIGATSIDVEGVHFSAGIDFTFPHLIVAAGQRVVIASNPVALLTRYPGLTIAGTFTGQLDDGGEPLSLDSALNINIQSFVYDDAWYPITDGQGYSLVVVNSAAATTTWNLKSNWKPSQLTGGNPNLADTGLAPGSVVISELLTNTTAPNGDTLELRNTTAAPINLGGWFLSNANTSTAAYKKYTFPAGTTIAAGGYLLLTEADFNSPTPGSNTRFTFSASGGSVFLTASDGAGNLAGYRDEETFAAADPEVPFTLYTKSTGETDFVAESAATFGAANAIPRVGPVVINEVMYHPALGKDEYIELLNISGAPVPLFDPANTSSSWAFTGGLTYTFPTGGAAATLPAGSYALVVGIAPNTFRTKYNIPAAVQIFGPFTGSLDDAGEALEISKPLAGSPGSYVLIDRLKYQPVAPWPTEPDGAGFSLSRYAASAYGNDVANWRSSTANGTPGTLNVTIDTTPPSVPTDVTALYTATTTVTLNWAASVDAQTPVTQYRIYRDNVQIGTSVTPTYSDNTVAASGIYNYQIAAVNGDGFASALSVPARSNHAPVAVNNSFTLAENTTYTTPSPVNTALTLVQGGSGGVLWRYLDNGTNQGTTWRNPGFNDNGWATGRGQLGYGDGDETTVINGGPVGNRFITSYFRYAFNVAAGDTALLTNLKMSLIRDDGAVVYLNGTEIWRENMPGVDGDNTITFTTLASASHENAVDIFDVPAGVLHDGTNTLAIEIHQRAVDSSDVSFDLTFTGTRLGNGLLNNDVDADNDPLTAQIVAPPAHGTLTINSSGGIIYTPTANYDGVDSFTYRASDGLNTSNTATVALTITGVNQPPVAVADPYTTSEDTPLIVPAATGVLANDTDPEFNSLTAVVMTGPSHGVLVLSTNGSFTYTPAGDYNGTDSFTYRANDGALNSNIATVSLTVSPVNDAPVAVADPYMTSEDTPLIVPAATGILANDTDPENNALTAVVMVGPSHGVLVLNANGSFTYTPVGDYNGADSFTYRANDGALNSNIASVSLTITAVNDAPVAVADPYTTSEDTPLIVPAATGVLANDTDVENSVLTAAVVVGPSHGVLVLNANGSFTYTPAGDYNGTDSFTYRANDGALNSNIATVSLTVSPVNDAPVADAGGPYSVPVGATLILDGTGSSDLETAPGSLTYEWDLNYNGVAFDVDATGIQPSMSFPAPFTARTIALRVSDQTLSSIATTTLEVTTVTSVVGRRLFYNNSQFDGNGGTAAADDAAIAIDKEPLLPGGTATFANYSSFSRGMNGIMLDIANLSATPSAADFAFRVGNDNSPSLWSAAPAPQSISVRSGAGSGGSSRVTIAWADGEIANTWLQVTALSSLGIAQNDVFYFGNAIGESGNSPGNAVVNSTDEIGARTNPRTFMNPALTDSVYDFNRDGFVNATDQIIARSNATTLAAALQLISAPASLSDNQPPLDMVAASLALPTPTLMLPGLASSANATALAEPDRTTAQAIRPAAPLAVDGVFAAWDEINGETIAADPRDPDDLVLAVLADIDFGVG